MCYSATAVLTVLKHNSTFIDIDCPGDTILYKCVINSNSEDLHLIWTVSFPGLAPLQITYDLLSVPDSVDNLNMNISTVLIGTIDEDTLQSTLLLKLLKNVTMNGTKVECSITPQLANDSMIVAVNRSGIILLIRVAIK